MEEIQLKFATKKSDYTLEITPELEQKIRYLCNKFPQREWSGILFYDYTGAFASNDIKFIAKDFLFMDEGDATSTEFDLDNPDVVGYMCDNDLFGCQSGLCHSHNAMSAFFSGQDDSMLKQEGAKRNHFLSLVVNNAGKYVARVTSKETYKYTIEGIATFKTFNDEAATKEVKEEKEQIVVMAYDLNIVMPESTTCFDDLDTRIEECRKAKEEKKKKEKTGTQQVLPFDLYNQGQNLIKGYKDPHIYPASKEKENKEDNPYIDDDILTEEECGNYAAQLITLNPFAKKSDIHPFLIHMSEKIEERFESVDEYRTFLNLIIDEVLDFELGCELLTYTQEEENIDIYLNNARAQIAAFIEEVTKFNKNDYIDIILKQLYA